MAKNLNSFSSRGALSSGGKNYDIFRLGALAGKYPVERLPYSLRIFLENLLRNEDGRFVGRKEVEGAANWTKTRKAGAESSYMPARVLMQDFTGVPAVVDLAVMRDAVKKLGGDPAKINPLIPVNLVIDHSVQVDSYGKPDSFDFNTKKEYERNRERYLFLKWGQKAFSNFSVVPPETGIIHQVNLEHLAKVVYTREEDGRTLAYPDTLVGTDSHTTMTNGLGVMSWGVGGIEAEACMLGQPLAMVVPDVIGFRLSGRAAEGVTATDVVLTVTQMLRKKGVVEKFVEFFGPGIGSLSVADRALIANMSPEYGATIGFFPVDSKTLDYMALTGRPEQLIRLTEDYCKEQGMFRTDGSKDPEFTDTLELDLASVKPSLAGPRRPQDRITLADSKAEWSKALPTFLEKDKKADPAARAELELNGKKGELTHGSVVIAAITSCTNTSNPSVMLAAGLMARKAVEKGLASKPWVKTSLSPGSRVVMDYYREAGVLAPLEKLGFNLTGFGCMTCIGNSGPLDEPVAKAVTDKRLVVASVLSGNRNFEGRINPLVKASFLASPPLVVAYALAGTVNIDLAKDPLGTGKDGKPVYLRDIWPTNAEVAEAEARSVKKEFFRDQYAVVTKGDSHWKELDAPEGELFAWQPDSYYVRKPPYFDGFDGNPLEIKDIRGARALAVLGDSVTTDHISPAGNIAKDSPAGLYLQERGIKPADFNSYGARRGNHEVMMRGTFANIRLRNALLGGAEGWKTLHLPDGAETSIFEAAMRYKEEGVPLVILAGKEYGSGSSRDWAAKGPALLGVRAVLASSFERIHRSNLVGMGILPLQFKPGEDIASLGLTGRETFDIEGIAGGLRPGQDVTVKAAADGKTKTFTAVLRINTPAEVEYCKYGGILSFVLAQLAAEKAPA